MLFGGCRFLRQSFFIYLRLGETVGHPLVLICGVKYGCTDGKGGKTDEANMRCEHSYGCLPPQST